MGKLLLQGIEGTIKGKQFFIHLGESVLVGRSSSCDIPLDSGVTEYLLDEPKEKAHFRTVSRRHLRICYYQEGEVELEDLSSNGSFLNNQPFRRKTIFDIKSQVHTILLGTQEKFILKWMPD